jgi:hypothetical protein
MIAVLKQGSRSSVIHQVLRKLSTAKSLKAVNAMKYCGVIQLQEKPLKIQKKMRDEWE